MSQPIAVCAVLAFCAVAFGQSATRPSLPIKVSENGCHLVDSKGNPFLVVGDTPWSLLVQPDGNGIQQYLQDRQKRGFNSIIVNLIEHKFCAEPPLTRAGLAPFSTPGDFSTPNEKYFDWAAKIVQQAGEHGMVVWIFPAFLGANGGDEGFFREIKAGGKERLRAYGRFVGKRFLYLPNIVWVVGGDYTMAKDDQWTVTELAEGIREADPDRLMTAHLSRGFPAVHLFGDRKWLTVNTAYTNEKDMAVQLLAEYPRKPVRPFVLIEAIYEGEHDASAELIRRQAWCAILSGASGGFFGNNPIWHFDGPGLFSVKTTWQEALDSQGARDMTILRNFLGSLPWHQLAPEANHAIVTAGYARGTELAMTAHTPNRRLSITYVPSSGGGRRELTIDLAGFPGPVAVSWLDPRTGKTTVVDGSPFANRESRAFRTPDDRNDGAHDWVLVLTANEPIQR